VPTRFETAHEVGDRRVPARTAAEGGDDDRDAQPVRPSARRAGARQGCGAVAQNVEQLERRLDRDAGGAVATGQAAQRRHRESVWRLTGRLTSRTWRLPASAVCSERNTVASNRSIDRYVCASIR